MKPLILTFLAVPILGAQRKQGSPLDHLPKNMEVISHFGARPEADLKQLVRL